MYILGIQLVLWRFDKKETCDILRIKAAYNIRFKYQKVLENWGNKISYKKREKAVS